MDSNKLSIFGKMIELTEEIVFIYNTEKKCFDHINGAFTEITQIDSAALFDQPQLLFDVVHIDTVARKIYFTRIGAGTDREFSY